MAAVVSAAKPWTGSSFTTCWPIVRMIRQPPAAVPSEIAVAASRITHSGTTGVGEDPGRDERERDDAHRLLRVVRAVAERHVRGRDHLEAPESVVDPLRMGPRNTFRITTMSANPITMPRMGDATSGKSTLSTMPWTMRDPGPGRDRRADEPADQRVARGVGCRAAT